MSDAAVIVDDRSDDADDSSCSMAQALFLALVVPVSFEVLLDAPLEPEEAALPLPDDPPLSLLPDLSPDLLPDLSPALALPLPESLSLVDPDEPLSDELELDALSDELSLEDRSSEPELDEPPWLEAA